MPRFGYPAGFEEDATPSEKQTYQNIMGRALAYYERGNYEASDREYRWSIRFAIQVMEQARQQRALSRRRNRR